MSSRIESDPLASFVFPYRREVCKQHVEMFTCEVFPRSPTHENIAAIRSTQHSPQKYPLPTGWQERTLLVLKCLTSRQHTVIYIIYSNYTTLYSIISKYYHLSHQNHYDQCITSINATLHWVVLLMEKFKSLKLI